MKKENKPITIAIPKSTFILTIVGMVTAIISGTSIVDTGLTISQYFTHYLTMFISCVCFVKAISSIHAYEIQEETEHENEINSNQQR